MTKALSHHENTCDYRHDGWQLTGHLQNLGITSAIDTLDKVFAINGEFVSRGPSNQVIRTRLGDTTLYIKRYQRAGASNLRRYFGRSRVNRESNNLKLFEQAGIKTPRLLAYGEEYRYGSFKRGAIITEGVADSINLHQLAHQQPDLLADRTLLRELLSQVARQARILHDRSFCHNDLDWRNILVRIDAETKKPEVFFFDCPSGSFWCWPIMEYRKIKDLAHLEKMARRHLPIRWRLWFYKQYSGKKKLDKKDRQQLRKVASYCDKKGW